MVSAVKGFDARRLARLRYAAERDRRQSERRTRDVPVDEDRRAGERRVSERRCVLSGDASSPVSR